MPILNYIKNITETRLWYISKKILPVFIIWSLIITTISIIDYRASCHEAFCGQKSTYNIPQNTAMPWDGGWYVSIVDGGYHYSPSVIKEFNIAFFPVAPLFYKFFKIISFNNINLYLAISVIFNMVLFLLSLVFSIRIVEMLVETNIKDGWLLLICLLAISLPSNLFIPTIYADSILIFCLSGCLLFTIKRHLLVAAILAGLASGTKSIGLAGFVILLSAFVLDLIPSISKPVEFIRKKLLPFSLLLIVSLSGIVGYSTYLKVKFNEPLAFIKVQKAWQRNTDSNILLSAKKIVKTNIIGLLRPSRMPEANVDNNAENKLEKNFVKKSKIFYAVFNTLNFIVIAISTIIIFIKAVADKYPEKRRALLLVCALLATMWIIPASTGTLWSMNRYLILPSLLVYILAAYAFLKKCSDCNTKPVAPYLVLLPVTIVLLLTQILFFWLFLNWVFVG